jgi:tRNA(Ile)-lysidine synthase
MQSCLELIPDDAQRVFVAFSGGLDSTVLLHLLVADPRKFKIIPWHFNHGLLDVASDMEQFCIGQAELLGLEIRVDQLRLDKIESNVEAVARHKRYALFAQHTHAGDCILTAHHADDQAETFLLNALRGSGSAGLRGIARQRVLDGGALLLRPLLDSSRNQLETYAREHKLSWVDDPSNQTSKFDRNYLRNQVIPLLKTRWPNFQRSLATASELQSEIQDVLDEVAALDFLQLKSSPSRGIATLDVAQLMLLSPGRRKNLVRYWITDAGLPVISHARMQELMHQIHAKADAIPEITMPDYSIRIYDQRLFLVVNDKLHERSGSSDFGLRTNVAIEKFDLRMQRCEIFRELGFSDQNQALSLKFRDDGQQNDDRHRLKRMFQKHRVPPWERTVIAQVYLDGKLEGLLL